MSTRPLPTGEPLRRPARRQRRVRAVALAVVLGAVPVGLLQVHLASAATLGVTSTAVGSGYVAVAPCTNLTGTSLGYVVAGGSITGLTVAGLTASCDGKRVSVTLLQGGTAVASAGPVVVTGGSATFTVLSTNPPAGAVSGASLVAVG